MGESSSARCKRAVAFVILHAGVGDSSIGLELAGGKASSLAEGETVREKRMSRIELLSSVSCSLRSAGEGVGEGDSLCLTPAVMDGANGLDGEAL